MLQRVSPAFEPPVDWAIMAESDDFRRAMRAFAGSVCVLTASGDSGPTGCVASSVSSFSADPPVLALSLSGRCSTARALDVGCPLGVSLLGPSNEAVARRFSGFFGASGAARYDGADWVRVAPGAQVLADALIGLGCEVEEIVPRHGQILVLARVCSINRAAGGGAPLLYWDGDYRRLDQDDRGLLC